MKGHYAGSDRSVTYFSTYFRDAFTSYGSSVYLKALWDSMRFYVNGNDGTSRVKMSLVGL